MVRIKSLTPIQQLGLLKHEFPASTGSVRNGCMIWSGDFQPSSLSETYKLRVVYLQGKYPKAYIDSPKPLKLAEGAKILPHTYNYHNGKQQICLFLPPEWNASMLISNTIVHWAIQWMYYYELWASTGMWLGGGHGNWDVEKPLSKDNESIDLD